MHPQEQKEQMFQAKADVDPLIAEQKTIASRRQRFEERTKRFMDARSRTMGMDCDALTQQIAERQQREQCELEREAFFDGEMNRHAEMIKKLENERILATKRSELELQRYREQQAQEMLHRKQTEEAALREPIDQGCPILNMQGCDINNAARTKAQVMQQQDWLNAQVHERMSREEAERQEQLVYEQAAQEINEKLARLMKLKEEQEAEARRQLRQTHLAQQEEMRLRREWEKLREDRMAQQEIEHMMNSALLNELSRTRRDNAHRAIPAEFKGFNQSQRQAILDEQRRQIEEMKLRREREQSEEQAWVDRMEEDRRKLVMLQREADMNRKTALLALQREREAQAHSNTVRSEYLNKVVYRNEITDEFFGKFGKSCR